MIKILIVEDEKAINDLIRISLEKNNYKCTCAYDGISACDLLEENTYDLILLDIMLPRANGFEVLEFANTLNMPIIFLTAKNRVEDKVKGLTMGAEDYIVKPFEIAELLARVEVVLRRYNKKGNLLEFDEFVIDLKNNSVKKDERIIELRSKELELFIYLIRNKNITLNRSTIFEQVWESDYTGDTRTIDLHIQRLRKKLDLGNRLQTEFRIGYRLENR